MTAPALSRAGEGEGKEPAFEDSQMFDTLVDCALAIRKMCRTEEGRKRWAEMQEEKPQLCRLLTEFVKICREGGMRL